MPPARYIIPLVIIGIVVMLSVFTVRQTEQALLTMAGEIRRLAAASK